MKVLSIDPGSEQSAYCIIDSETYKPLEFAKVENKELVDMLIYNFRINLFSPFVYNVIIEMIDSYGMPVGKTVFETCVWIGRFIQIADEHNIPYEYIYRKEEKINLCHSMKAKDSNIRQALIDRFGEVGTKKNPRLVLWI